MIDVEKLTASMTSWFNRRTTTSALRRVGELPICIGSDTGIVRKENQDRVAVIRIPSKKNKHLTILALCDGMGGMENGSLCASQSISAFFGACIKYHDYPLKKIAAIAVQEANRVVFTANNERGGATLSAVLADSENRMVGVNVGDSRIYSFHKEQIKQISTDDTFEGLFNKPGRELLQFIGMKDEIDPHILEFSVPPEYTLITSDGVHFIEDTVMQKLFTNAKSYTSAAKRLLDVSTFFGGHDNASILIAENLFSGRALPTSVGGTIQIWDPFGELTILFSTLVESKEKAVTQRKKSTKKDSPTKGKSPRKKKVKETLPVGKLQQMVISYGDNDENV